MYGDDTLTLETDGQITVTISRFALRMTQRLPKRQQRTTIPGCNLMNLYNVLVTV